MARKSAIAAKVHESQLQIEMHQREIAFHERLIDALRSTEKAKAKVKPRSGKASATPPAVNE